MLGALVRVRRDAPPEVEHSLQLPSDAQGADVVGHVVSVARSLVSHAGEQAPVAVGAGLAGLVGIDGLVRRSPNAPGLEGVDVADRLRSATAVPAVIDNDANCAAWAAVVAGAGRRSATSCSSPWAPASAVAW